MKHTKSSDTSDNSKQPDMLKTHTGGSQWQKTSMNSANLVEPARQTRLTTDDQVDYCNHYQSQIDLGNQSEWTLLAHYQHQTDMTIYLGDYVTITGISQFGITTKFQPKLLIWNVPSMLEYRV
ncbi:hypothetical protein Clacol_009623 [Clathrus columnatus]|uniref:Uncharacterized protein n=1 Tax=Clathrus columnatus TaxID=1419009 RepID=A0AAV5AL02_9AGAM|nr:hypothetical protein Clacol_009623 [Clathrus columnatus]